jgi:hypothetical protein
MNIRSTLFAAVALLASLAAATADAQGAIYTCRDRAGHTLTSDRPIGDCAGTMRELGPSGVVRREIAPPLTAEQQKQKDIDDKARRLAAEATREQHRRDVALLTAYQSEDQIESARRRALVDPEASIKTSQSRLEDLDHEKQTLTKELATYQGKAVPPLVKRKVEDNQALIDDEGKSIRSRQVDIERINQRYDDDRKRYRELNVSR